jgi:hypothetical protein
MRRHITVHGSIVLLGLVMAMPAQAKDILLGKWSVTITRDDDSPRAGEKEFKDTLNFTGGNFESEKFKKAGFDATAYEEDTRGVQTIVFTVKPKSDEEGEMKWTGQAVANEISGEMTWTKKDGTEIKYTFKGNRAEK